MSVHRSPSASGRMSGVSGVRVWSAEDATGGSLDRVLSRVRAVCPDVEVYRLVASHPADDDNVFWIRRGIFEVQIDTSRSGTPPFLIESDRPGSRLQTSDAESAARLVVEELTQG